MILKTFPTFTMEMTPRKTMMDRSLPLSLEGQQQAIQPQDIYNQESSQQTPKPETSSPGGP